ncbi:hypothetical protein [Methylocystis heyeri]|uniref:Porin n=1 Tax=Methylocystis heyeri TaxID=391905 RepID=A0A6B8KEF9_9HYPH|nr:hypothetical protein [Methylocystis heyeri]QGM44823.1 hypothetical protein H2LOC_003480 [Methylocystis heyeri]
MRKTIFGALALATLASASLIPSEAGAVVCARGRYHAGCAAAAPRGAVVVRPAPRAVVVRPAPRAVIVR